jgi:hypothetical protein
LIFQLFPVPKSNGITIADIKSSRYGVHRHGVEAARAYKPLLLLRRGIAGSERGVVGGREAVEVPVGDGG